jgi:hypothetical protein
VAGAWPKRCRADPTYSEDGAGHDRRGRGKLYRSPRGRAEGRARRTTMPADGQTEFKLAEALVATSVRSRRTRRLSSIEGRRQAITTELESADAIERLRLVQERRDLRQQLESTGPEIDLAAYEAAFVEVGWSSAGGESSSERWREVGVPAATLRRPGITRGR